MVCDELEAMVIPYPKKEAMVIEEDKSEIVAVSFNLLHCIRVLVGHKL